MASHAKIGLQKSVLCMCDVTMIVMDVAWG